MMYFNQYYYLPGRIKQTEGTLISQLNIELTNYSTMSVRSNSLIQIKWIAQLTPDVENPQVTWLDKRSQPLNRVHFFILYRVETPLYSL